MSVLPYIIFLFAFSSIFILASQLLLYEQKRKLMRERFVSLKEGQREKHLWLKPLFTPLAPLNARIGGKKFRKKLGQRLFAAGSPLTVNEYFVFKELFTLFIPLLLAAVIGWDKLLANPVLILITAGVGFIYPEFWLRAKVEKRKRAILRALPNIIDLLILAIDAGLDFMIAVRRVVERSRPGPMVDELSYLYQQVQVGRVRKEALRNMGQRLNIPEVHSFTRTLIQAERMGTPMGEALRTLSEEIRLRRFQRGEQQALKAPMKMLFPLLFFILPVVLILVGAPVLLQFFQSGINFLK